MTTNPTPPAQPVVPQVGMATELNDALERIEELEEEKKAMLAIFPPDKDKLRDGFLSVLRDEGYDAEELTKMCAELSAENAVLTSAHARAYVASHPAPIASSGADVAQKKREKKSPPPWFAKAMGAATAEDIFNALSDAQKQEVEKSLVDRGEPPAWYLQMCTDAGLTFAARQAPTETSKG